MIAHRALFMFVTAAVLSGCIGFIEPDYLLPAKRIAKVRETADLYGQLLRFGRIGEAAGFVRDEDRKAFLEAFMSSGMRLAFTNAEVMTVETATAMTVEVWTTYDFYAPPSLSIRTLSEKQVWHFDAVRREWKVQPDLTAFPGAKPAPAPAAPAQTAPAAAS
jgi:hypothetical protein